jgi:hypothetical protein
VINKNPKQYNFSTPSRTGSATSRFKTKQVHDPTGGLEHYITCSISKEEILGLEFYTTDK